MDYSYYYDAARQALDLHASMLSPDNMKWLQTLPYEVREGGADSPNGAPKDHVISFCHGSPINIEEFEYIFAPEQAARCLPEWDNWPTSPSSATRTCASRSRCRTTTCTRWWRRSSSCGPGTSTSSASGRWGSRAITTTAPATRIYDTDERVFEFKRVAYDIDSAAQKIFGAKLERNFGNRLFIGV